LDALTLENEDVSQNGGCNLVVDRPDASLEAFSGVSNLPLGAGV